MIKIYGVKRFVVVMGVGLLASAFLGSLVWHLPSSPCQPAYLIVNKRNAVISCPDPRQELNQMIAPYIESDGATIVTFGCRCHPEPPTKKP